MSPHLTPQSSHQFPSRFPQSLGLLHLSSADLRSCPEWNRLRDLQGQGKGIATPTIVVPGTSWAHMKLTMCLQRPANVSWGPNTPSNPQATHLFIWPLRSPLTWLGRKVLVGWCHVLIIIIIIPLLSSLVPSRGKASECPSHFLLCPSGPSFQSQGGNTVTWVLTTPGPQPKLGQGRTWQIQ